MTNEHQDHVIRSFTKAKESWTEKQVVKYKADLMVRCIRRLIQFSSECKTCVELLQKLHTLFESEQQTDEEKSEWFSRYNKQKAEVIRHLEKTHKLVDDQHYLSLYMSLGIAMGVPLGLMFGNIALGLPIGMGIGIAIGAGMDADAKKKNHVI